jgi:hypothetical protein
MRVEIHALPRVELAWVGSAREKAEYMQAHEELRIEVARELPPVHEPFKRAHLSIVAYVGQGEAGFYRPTCAHTLQVALDPVYRALIEREYIKDMKAVPLITTGVITGSEFEGLQISIEELP